MEAFKLLIDILYHLCKEGLRILEKVVLELGFCIDHIFAGLEIMVMQLFTFEEDMHRLMNKGLVI